MPETRELTLPEQSGSREEAREFLASLPDAMPRVTVRIVGDELSASASSYVDELVKGILVERGAAKLILSRATPMANFYATSAAQRRHVLDRLVVQP